MDRLTVNDLNKVCYDPWELCGMDNYCKKGCHEEGGCTKGCHILKMYRKLAEYEDLEERGRLLKLPVAVGDKIWSITSTANYSLGYYSEVPLKHPEEKKIQSITLSKNGCLYHVKGRTYSEFDFGKTVFLTKSAAEQALKKMEGKK